MSTLDALVAAIDAHLDTIAENDRDAVREQLASRVVHPTATRTLVPSGELITKTVFTFSVLHRTDSPFTDPEDYDGPFESALGMAMSESWDGHAVGDQAVQLSVPVRPADVAAELVAMGNDGSFFEDDLDEAVDEG